jgi:multidrug efflux pump subunit AcrA (membrane-fusion protein)
VAAVTPPKAKDYVATGPIVVDVAAQLAESLELHLAKITVISPVVDPASDSIEVVAKLDGSPSGLRPGMTAQIHLPSPANHLP